MIGIDARSIEKHKTGVGRYLWNLLRLWPQYFRKETILYTKGDRIEDYNEIQDDYLKIKSLSTQSNFLFQHLALPLAAKRDKISLLFSPGYLLPVFYSGKTLLAVHDIIYKAKPDLYNWPSPADRFLLGYLGKKSVQKADFILTSSNFSRQEIIRYYKTKREKIKTILLGVDNVFKTKLSQGKIRAVLKKYQVERPYLLFVGSIFTRRFPLEMLAAYEAVVQTFPNLNFLILGKDLTRPALKIAKRIELINQKGGHTKRLDYAPDRDLVALYQGAEIFIWLSEYEGFGLPPLESMASGTPVISSPFGSLPEALGDAPFWIKNPWKPKEIISAIKQILSDRGFREGLSLRGITQASKFKWEKTAEDTNEIIESLL